MNQERILFWGIQRSGNHALINWILEQYDEPKMFLNNQTFGEKLTASPDHALDTLGREHFVSTRVFYSQKGETNWQEIWNNPSAGINNCLLISYENHDVSQLSEETYVSSCQAIDDDAVGKSLHTTNILLLRDPFNMWVSDLPNNSKPHDPYLWKVYAREYLGETQFLPNKICINYNQWFADKNYRVALSAQLGVPFSDKGLNVVSKFGGGSNFDGTKFNGKAQQMNVLNRWEQSKNFRKKKRLIRSLRRDAELRRLVQTIYPDLYHRWHRMTLDNFWYYYA